jgi:hypothetical protein
MNKKVPFIDNSRQSPLWVARNDWKGIYAKVFSFFILDSEFFFFAQQLIEAPAGFCGAAGSLHSK